MKEHKYKGCILKRNGTKEMPWNIYKMAKTPFGGIEYPEHWGEARTMKEAKANIDGYEEFECA